MQTQCGCFEFPKVSPLVVGCAGSTMRMHILKEAVKKYKVSLSSLGISNVFDDEVHARGKIIYKMSNAVHILSKLSRLLHRA